MRLRDRGPGEPLVPIVVVTIGAGEVELPLPQHEELLSLCDEWRKLRIIPHRNRHSARLSGNEGGECKKVSALIGERRRLLMPRALKVDALFEIDGATECLVVGGIARRHAPHAAIRIAVAVGTGFAGVAFLSLPQHIAIKNPEHAGIGGVVVLDCPGVRRHEIVAGAAPARKIFGGVHGKTRKQQRDERSCTRQAHSTVIEAEAVSENPLSPIHSNSNLPLSCATVKNDRNGLAATAGKRSARKISFPL